jgi:AraC family transcriptional regulator
MISTTIPKIEFTGERVKERTVPGFRFLLCRHNPGEFRRAHTHGDPYVNMAIEGACTERMSDQLTRVYEVGIPVYHPENEEHNSLIGSEGLLVFTFAINRDEFSREVLDLLPKEGMELRTSPYFELMQKMVAELDRDDVVSSISLNSLGLQMVTSLARQSEVVSSANIRRWLVEAKEYIEERYSENPRLTDIASYVEIHPVHLAQEFKRAYGTTVGQFSRSLRLERARKLLAETREPISNIAVKTGFYDPAHFSRVFKSQFGLTPSEFRRTMGITDIQLNVSVR